MVSYEVKLILSCLQTSADSDAYTCFDSITCEHPDLDTCTFQRVNSGLNIFLELIFNSRHTKEGHVSFNSLDYSLNGVFSVSYCTLCSVIFFHKGLQFLISEHLLCKNKSSESLHRKLLAKLKKESSLAYLNEPLHDNLSSLNIVDNLSSLLLLDEDRHLFALTRKWEVGNDFIVLVYSLAVLNLDICSVSFDKGHLDRVRVFHKSDLVWATGLEDHLGVRLLVRETVR